MGIVMVLALGGKYLVAVCQAVGAVHAYKVLCAVPGTRKFSVRCHYCYFLVLLLSTLFFHSVAPSFTKS